MRRVSRMWLAGALILVPALFLVHGAAGEQAAAQAAQPAAPPLTFDGEVALWTVGVNPGRTADFEQVMGRLKNALLRSDKPERRRQAAGWRIMRGQTNPQGQVMYTHIIDPVVRGANYNILEIIYEAVEEREEQVRIYEQYRGAFAGNLGLATGRIAVDLSR